MMISELFIGKKGQSMDKVDKMAYKDVFCLFLGFLFVALIFCGGMSVCCADDKASTKVDFVNRYISDGLLFFSELYSESGDDFLGAREIHRRLLGTYLREMKDRQLIYAATLLTEEAVSIERILKELRSIRKTLGEPVPTNKKDPNGWAKNDLEKVSKQLGDLLISFKPRLKVPFDIGDKFEKLGEECRKELRKALKEVTVRLDAYIEGITTNKANDLLMKRARELCEANREAIVYFYIFRFARFEDPEVNAETSGEGLDVRTLRQFSGDVNRTIYWNGVLQKRAEEKNAKLLRKYTASEFRRLRVLRAVTDRDMREAQGLLLETLFKSLKVKPISDENIEPVIEGY